MPEDDIFFRRAAEAIVATSLNTENAHPAIKELLKRLSVNQGSFEGIFGATLNTEKKHNNRELADMEQESDSLDSSYTLEKNQNVESLISIKPSNKMAALNNASFLLDFGTSRPNIGNTPNTQTPVHTLSAPLPETGRAPRNFNNSVVDDSFSRTVSASPKEEHPGEWKRMKALQEPTSENMREFPCSKCHLIFGRSSDLRRHEKAHLPILPNICPQCGKGFARKDALKRHFDTLTCKRNRSKLLSIGEGDITQLIKNTKDSLK